MELINRWFPRGFLLLNGLLYAYLTFLFVFAPIEWFARLGIELQAQLGYTELRTMYVGLMATLGIYSLLAACLPSITRSGLLLALLSYGLLALVRGSLILGGAGYDGFTLTLWYAELGSAAAAGLGLYLHDR